MTKLRRIRPPSLVGGFTGFTMVVPLFSPGDSAMTGNVQLFSWMLASFPVGLQDVTRDSAGDWKVCSCLFVLLAHFSHTEHFATIVENLLERVCILCLVLWLQYPLIKITIVLVWWTFTINGLIWPFLFYLSCSYTMFLEYGFVLFLKRLMPCQEVIGTMFYCWRTLWCKLPPT